MTEPKPTYRFAVLCPEHDRACIDAHCAAREKHEAAIHCTFVWTGEPIALAEAIYHQLTRAEMTSFLGYLCRRVDQRLNEHRVTWRGSVGDLVTDLAEGLQPSQLRALAREIEHRFFTPLKGDARELVNVLGADGSFDDGPESADRFDRPARTSGSLVPGDHQCPGNGGRCPIWITADRKLCSLCSDAAKMSESPPTERAYSAGHSVIQRLRGGIVHAPKMTAIIDRLEHGTATGADMDALASLGRAILGEDSWRNLFPEVAPVEPSSLGAALRAGPVRAVMLAPDVEPERCSCSEALWLRAKLRRVTGALRRANGFIDSALRAGAVD